MEFMNFRSRMVLRAATPQQSEEMSKTAGCVNHHDAEGSSPLPRRRVTRRLLYDEQYRNWLIDLLKEGSDEEMAAVILRDLNGPLRKPHAEQIADAIFGAWQNASMLILKVNAAGALVRIDAAKWGIDGNLQTSLLDGLYSDEPAIAEEAMDGIRHLNGDVRSSQRIVSALLALAARAEADIALRCSALAALSCSLDHDDVRVQIDAIASDSGPEPLVREARGLQDFWNSIQPVENRQPANRGTVFAVAPRLDQAGKSTETSDGQNFTFRPIALRKKYALAAEPKAARVVEPDSRISDILWKGEQDGLKSQIELEFASGSYFWATTTERAEFSGMQLCVTLEVSNDNGPEWVEIPLERIGRINKGIWGCKAQIKFAGDIVSEPKVVLLPTQD